MLVKDIMNRNVKIIRPDSTVQEAAEKMAEWRVGALVVISGPGMVVGLITERDILKKVVAKAKESGKIRVEDMMIKHEELILIEANASLEDAVKAMIEFGVKKLPVIERGQLVGMLTATDLINNDHALAGRMAELMVYPKRSKTKAIKR